MRDAQDWDEAYLLELTKVGERESLTLDYKASAALTKDSSKKNDLSKDVSAFANSAGGILVYGMLDDKHVPTSIDVGLDPNVITKEWLESVIKSTIRPIVDGVIIKPIDVPTKGADRVVYVVQIPPATSLAPHQAYDHRYYKRFNFKSTPMEDYEVRNLMRRSFDYGRKYGAAWDLNVEINRLVAAINQRSEMGNYNCLPRDRLVIAVSQALRSSGNAMVLLAKPLPDNVAELIKSVDEFNSIIETTDHRQGDNTCLNPNRKTELAKMLRLGLGISAALEKIRDEGP